MPEKDDRNRSDERQAPGQGNQRGAQDRNDTDRGRQGNQGGNQPNKSGQNQKNR